MTNQRPHPPEIYMRRRVAALVVLLVLAALIIWGLSAWAGNSGGDDEATSATATEPAPVTEPTVPAPEESTSASSEASSTVSSTAASTEPSSSEEPLASGKCELSDLRISASSDKPSYGPDEQPTFYMMVDNPTDTDCVLDISDGDLRFEVYDMATNQRVWADTDCYPSVTTGRQTFEAGTEKPFEARWSRADSKPGQCEGRQPVPAGSYYLHTVIGDNASDAMPFNLS